MAISFVQPVATVQDTVARSTYTSQTFVAVNGRLYLIVVIYTPHTASGGTISAIVSTGGLTCVIIGTATGLSFSGGSYAIAVARALVLSGAGSGTIAAQFATNRTGCIIHVIEVDGVDTSGTNGSGAVLQPTENTGLSGVSPSVALGPFGSINNATFGAFGTAINTIPTVGTNFTSVASGTYNSPNTAGRSEYALSNQTTVDASTTGDWGGFACEVVAASGGGGGSTILRKMMQHHHYRKRPSVGWRRATDSGLYLRSA